MRSRSERRYEFWRDVLVQALGTTLGGGILFVIGVASGVFADINWAQVRGYTIGTAIGGAILAVIEIRGKRLRDRFRRGEYEVSTPHVASAARGDRNERRP